jgi:hypothetical protein
MNRNHTICNISQTRMPKSKEVIEEFDCDWIGYIIDQYDKELAMNIRNLNKKKKVFSDLIWTKFLKSYRIYLCNKYDFKIIKQSVMRILVHFIEDESKIYDTLETFPL